MRQAPQRLLRGATKRWPGFLALSTAACTSCHTPQALRFVQVNAFADRPFSGNPAAVFLVPKVGQLQWSVGDDVMQKIAREMQLSETAFVTPAEGSGCFDSSTRFLLRWFTPTKEVDLCGHATLASAAALAIECSNSASTFDFETRSGTLTATRHRQHGTSGEFELDFPINPPHTVAENSIEAATHGEIAQLVLGERHSRAIVRLAYSPTTKKLVVQMNPALFGRAELEALAMPNPEQLLAIDQPGSCPVTGVMVTVESPDEHDFLSRYFAPWNGIPEDPVTGAAHTVLAPFWLEVLNKASPPQGAGVQLRARQCSPRGGNLIVTTKGPDRLGIRGNAITMLQGWLRLQHPL